LTDDSTVGEYITVLTMSRIWLT